MRKGALRRGGLQNEAREEEKCFIILSHPSDTSEVTEEIGGVHPHTSLIVTQSVRHLPCLWAALLFFVANFTPRDEMS